MAQKEVKPLTITMTVPARMDKKFGMGIVYSNNGVYISSILPGSLAAEHFNVKDRIVSILGVNVKDKEHCRELILLACDCESQFDVVVERPFASFVMPKLNPEDMSEIPDLQFLPHTTEASLKEDKKKDKSKKIQPAPIDYNSYMGDDEFGVGDPLDGLKFPMSVDVRDILNSRTSQILKDFLETPVDKSKAKQDDAFKLFTLDTSISQTKIAADINKKKFLIKPKR